MSNSMWRAVIALVQADAGDGVLCSWHLRCVCSVGPKRHHLRLLSPLAEIGLGQLVARVAGPMLGIGLYESADFETASNKVELRVEASLGSLDIR
jgi:hypothetical protein